MSKKKSRAQRLASASDRETSEHPGRTKRSRPRLPAEQKRRRGSVSVKLKGAGPMMSALKAMAPEMRRRFAEAMSGSLSHIGMDLAKGRDRCFQVEATVTGKLTFREVPTDAPRVRR